MHLKRERFYRPPGCNEKLDWEFIKYILRFETDRKPFIEDAIEAFGSNAAVHRLSNFKEILKIFIKA